MPCSPQMNDDGPGEHAGEGGLVIGGGRGGGEEVLDEQSDAIDNGEPGRSIPRPTLSPIFEELSWERDRFKPRSTIGVAAFIKRSALSAEEREVAHEERVHRIVEQLRKSQGTYVSDVFGCGSVERAHAFSERLQCNAGTFCREFLIISTHGDHVHVVHDCACSQGTCRCVFIQKTENSMGIRRRRRSIRRRPVCSSLSTSDIRNILQYFSEGRQGRKIENLQVSGRVERQQVQIGPMEDGGPERHPPGGRVEACSENNDSELQLDVTGRAYHYRVYSRTREENEEAPKGKRRKTDRFQLKTEKILKFLKMNPMAPIQGLLQHRIWNEHEDLKFIKEDDAQFKAALSNWLSILMGYSTTDFIRMYTHEDCNIIFAAGITDPGSYYFNVDDSYKYIMELLMFQFLDDSEAVRMFIIDMFNIIERKIPKLNTMLISSPTSAGKNWFFDMVCNFYLNVGHLGNPSKFNTFAFQDAHSRRIIMWNEVNYAPEHLETMKELLGGDSSNVSVKYKSEIPIYRTPIIMLTNSKNLSIMNDPTFKDRLKVYFWRAAPLLKPLLRKPHPLTVIKLYEQYVK
uniref:NS1 n=1 Tax=uncultured densovirus TaxID=748192 RepID=A0A7L7YQK2_9VIRU|nr:NS1 [uncultured densovirus]